MSSLHQSHLVFPGVECQEIPSSPLTPYEADIVQSDSCDGRWLTNASSVIEKHSNTRCHRHHRSSRSSSSTSRSRSSSSSRRSSSRSSRSRSSKSSSSSSRSIRAKKTDVTSVAALVVIASVSLILSSTGLALTTVAMTARRRTAEELALNKSLEMPERRLQMKTHEAKEFVTRDYLRKEEKLDSAFAKQSYPKANRGTTRINESKGAKSKPKDAVYCQCDQVTRSPGSTVAAHLSRAENSQKDLHVKWSQEELNSNVMCRNGRLVAPQDGIYAIYSQLYVFAYSPEEERHISLLRHSVCRQDPSDESEGQGMAENKVELMERSWTLTWNSVGESSSYLAGIFELRADDELLVDWTANDPLFEVHSDPKRSYFGIFKVK